MALSGILHRKEVVELTHEEKAELILETLASNSMNINWNLAVYYLKDIKKALREIEKLEIEKILDKNSPPRQWRAKNKSI